MKILIYGINYAPEKTGIGKYSGEMANWLATKGHEVRVVAAPPYYPEWQVHGGYNGLGFNISTVEGVKVYRCPLYVPRNVTTLKRLLHLSSFALSSLVPLGRNIVWKPDVIVTVVPTLFTAINARLFAKLSGARSVLHIQDYELDAMLGLGLGRGGLASRVAQSVEKWMLRGFDRVSTISQSMMNKARQKGVDQQRVIFFPNWSSPFKAPEVGSINELKLRLNLTEADPILLYSGNLGEKQGLELVVEAADVYAKQHTQGCFVIVGDGSAKQRLMQMVSDRQLNNVRFYPLQSLQDLPKLLSMADCHLVIQRRGAADSVLPSKLTNILAVGGNAVITADSSTELGILCERYPGIAACVEPESLEALLQGLETVLAMPPRNLVALDYAGKYLSQEYILSDFEQTLKYLAPSELAHSKESL